MQALHIRPHVAEEPRDFLPVLCSVSLDDVAKTLVFFRGPFPTEIGALIAST